VPPGRILRRELEERGWTQQDLADILGRPVQAVNQIIQGRKQITPETAIALSQALGTSPDFWTNLEAAYRLQIAAGQPPDEGIRRRGKLYGVAPVRDLVKRGWVEDTADELAFERNILRFLGLPNLDAPLPQVANFRCSAARTPDQRCLFAWTRRVEMLAGDQAPAPYDRERLAAAVPQILELAQRPEQIAEVPARLLGLGLRCVVVPRLDKTYADGAALHAGDAPIVALTLRLDRIDNFWITLMHELAHIVLGHDGSYIDETDGDECVRDDAREKKADRLASDWLVPRGPYRRFLAARGSRFPLAAIEEFAGAIGRHPGVVVGRLHHDGRLSFKYLRQTLVKVSPYLEPWVDRAMPSGTTPRTPGPCD